MSKRKTTRKACKLEMPPPSPDTPEAVAQVGKLASSILDDYHGSVGSRYGVERGERDSRRRHRAVDAVVAAERTVADAAARLERELDARVTSPVGLGVERRGRSRNPRPPNGRRCRILVPAGATETAAEVMAIIRQAIKWAVAKGHVETNVPDAVKRRTASAALQAAKSCLRFVVLTAARWIP